jgi:capsular exopolysaccharide synthesis family protein
MARDQWEDTAGRSEVRPVRPIPAPRPEPRPELQEVLSVLWYRKWSILAVTLLTVGVALYVSSQQTPIYESQASVLVTPIDTGADTLPPVAPNLPTEAEVVSSVAVAKVVADNLGIKGDPRDLLADLEVDQPTDTEILDLTYRNPDPVRAQRLAMGFAEGYLQFREAAASKLIVERAKDLEDQIAVFEQRLKTIQDGLERLPADDPREGALQTEAASLQNLILQTQVTRLGLPQEVSGGEVIQPASVPGSPGSPDHVVNGAFGLAAGLALGSGLALVRDRMSGRLRSSDEVEEYLEAPVLGVVPQVSEWRRGKKAYLVAAARWRSPAAEAYRVIRTNLLSALPTGAKSIVVTSTHSGEGKSATVANLAVVLAGAGKRVTLVSADLRRPRLHEFFLRDGRVGLSDVLGRGIALDAAIQEVTLLSSAAKDLSAVSLRLVSSGPVPDDPAELLGSGAMRMVIEDLERVSDIVLIDAPPVLPVTDAPVVAAMTKNVLLVIGPNSATRGSVVSARQQLERVGARIVGGILNGPHAIKAESFGYY